MRSAGRVLLALALLAAALPAEGKPEFPVARAEAEFRGLLAFVDGFGKQNEGNVELVRRWCLPFGPMDLQVGKASHEEAASLRNFYLGFVGAAFGVDTARLAESFHCGEACVAGRRRDLEAKRPRIQALVDDFRKLEGVNVVAAWGIKDQYRVNDLFKIEGQTNVTSPSAELGFVPSSSWKRSSFDDYLASIGASPAAVQRVLSALTALSIAALVRQADGAIRVVRIGIGENESGLVFSSPKLPPLKVGAKLPDGRQIKILRDLKKGVFFYESS